MCVSCAFAEDGAFLETPAFYPRTGRGEAVRRTMKKASSTDENGEKGTTKKAKKASSSGKGG